ncbi:MAG: hypothetical protein NZV61_00570 [Candidatus Bipolaricaulota bacterium]|nr:hypothetical protein [Candidatus Bipolaricaulota bacterium]
MRMLEGAKVQRLLGKLREKARFQQFEQRLRERGKRLAAGKLRVLLDETSKLAIVGLVNEGSERVAHQLRIRLKANKDDEPEENAEPQLQATACGQASGEAVAVAQGEQLQPQFEGGFGGGGNWGGYEGPQICTSQWGYSYACYSTTPILRMENAPVHIGTFVGQPARGRLIIYNGGGGTLTGTVTVAAPFTLVSGGSFSLGPGQPQEVVVEFTPAVEGETYSMLTVQSNMPTLPTAQVSVKGVAIEVERFYQLLSGLSQGLELNTVVPGGTVDMGLLGFKNLSVSDLRALMDLAKAQDLESRIELNQRIPIPPPPGVPPWIWGLIVDFVLDQTMSFFNNQREQGFSISEATSKIQSLANILKTLGETHGFNPTFESYLTENQGRNNFRYFVNALSDALQRAAQAGGGIALYRAFGATNAQDAARGVILSLAHAINNLSETGRSKLVTILDRFGPAAAFCIAGAEKRDRLILLPTLVNDLNNIISRQVGNRSLHEGRVLWKQFVNVLATIGFGALFAETNEGTRNLFNQTLAAVAVTSEMLTRGGGWNDPNGWKIHAIRTYFQVGAASGNPSMVLVDVVATSRFDFGNQSKPTALFGQFFHAVTGYQGNDITNLVRLVKEVARNKMGEIGSLGLDGPNGQEIWNAQQRDGKIGAVIAVNSANLADAQSRINLTNSDGDFCGGRCFAIIIEIRNGIVYAIHAYGISQQEAEEIARRMGFVRNDPPPWVRYLGVEVLSIINDKKALVNYTPTPRDPNPRYCVVCQD